jgi:hypothetical protein
MNDKQPVYVMPENVSRTLGRDAQRNNILAAKIVADVVKTTLGPKGMDKMLVDSSGNIIVTNDGVTILEEMEIEHGAVVVATGARAMTPSEYLYGTDARVVRRRFRDPLQRGEVDAADGEHRPDDVDGQHLVEDAEGRGVVEVRVADHREPRRGVRGPGPGQQRRGFGRRRPLERGSGAGCEEEGEGRECGTGRDTSDVVHE